MGQSVSLADLIASTIIAPDRCRYVISDGWKQGRTAFGGLSAGLCLHAARTLTGETGALRSAMISFVGPASDDLAASATLLRASRTAAAVRATLTSAGAAATEAVFTFSDLRESALRPVTLAMPEVPRPPLADGIDFAQLGGPSFAANFEVFPAGGAMPMSGAEIAHIRWWVRHRHATTGDLALDLLVLGDVLPPAALTTLQGPTRLSSMTWMVDVIADDLSSDGGWYLLDSRADTIGGGFSSQDMSLWGADGRLLCKGRQMVSLFA